jgi:hypothetical protein
VSWRVNGLVFPQFPQWPYSEKPVEARSLGVETTKNMGKRFGKRFGKRHKSTTQNAG